MSVPANNGEQAAQQVSDQEYRPSRMEAYDAMVREHRHDPARDGDMAHCAMCLKKWNMELAEKNIASTAALGRIAANQNGDSALANQYIHDIGLKAVMPEKPKTILDEANSLTGNGGDRNDAYDHPFPNFSKIAAVWSVIFDKEVTPRQVALAMIGMKMVRDNHSAKRDNIVDIAGYARCIERLEEWAEKGAKS